MARFNSGWIKLHRSSLDSKIYKKDSHWRLWTTLLLWASYEDQEGIPAGTVLIGIDDLAAFLKWPKSTLRDRLKSALFTERVSLHNSDRGTIITIRNWSKYQNDENEPRSDSVESPQETRSKSVENPTLIKNKELRIKKKEGNTGASALPRLAEIWNEHSGKLPKVRGCSSARLASVNARWKENDSEAYWIEVIKTLADSPFCNGASDRKWVADFDFLLQPDTQHKALEGKYGKRTSSVVESNRQKEDEYKAEQARLMAQAEKEYEQKLVEMGLA